MMSARANFIKAVLLFLAAIFLLSCHARKFRVRTATVMQKPAAKRVMDIIVQKQQRRHSISLRATLKLDSKRKRVFLKQLILARRPESIYLTSLKFGSPVIYISIDGAEVSAFDPKGTFFKGTGTGEVIGKITGIDLRTRDLMALILGSLYVCSDYSIERADLVNERYYRISYDCNEGLNRSILVDSKDMKVIRGKITGEEFAVQAVFSNFKAVGEAKYPYRIEVMQREPYFEFVLKSEEVKLNIPINKDNLTIKSPPGIVPLPIEDLERLF